MSRHLIILAAAGDDTISGDGPSRTELASDAERARARKERETWNVPEGESRQVRRARERAAFKRLPGKA